MSSTVDASGKPVMNDVFDLPNDLQTVADYAHFRGTRMVGTNAEMLQFQADGFLRDGYLWWNTTDAREYRGVGGLWKPAVRVATYSFLSNGVPDGVLLGSGLLTQIGAETNDPSFVMSVTGSALRLKMGLYSFGFSMHLGSGVSATGRTFVEANTATMVQRSNAPIGEDRFSVAGVYYAPADNTEVKFQVFKTTGGLANLSGHLRVVRLG